MQKFVNILRKSVHRQKKNGTCFCVSFGSFLLCGSNFILGHKHTHWHFVFYEIRLQNLPVYSHTWIIERERQTKAAREWEVGGGAFCLTSVCFLEAGRNWDGGRGRGGEREGVGCGFGQRRTRWRQHFVTLSDNKHAHTHTYSLSQIISSLLKDIYCWKPCLIAALKLTVLYGTSNFFVVAYLTVLFQCCFRCF